VLNSHQKRLLTAAILIVLLLVVIWQNNFWHNLAISLISCFGLLEFYAFFWPRQNVCLKGLGLILAGLLIWLPLVGPKAFGLLGIILFWNGALYFLLNFAQQKPIGFADLGLMLAGILYIPFNLKLFQQLDPAEIILVLAASFGSDTGAYYAGSLWGKRKIWPQVSPKKTWMGAFGGLLSCLIIVELWGTWQKHNLLNCLILGIILGVAAQLGDFFESALKRACAIKDSGSILPGHGGILDRIDSLLLVLPVYIVVRSLII